MAQIIFTYIEKSKFKIENQSINFSNNFKVSLQNNSLIIEKEKPDIDFFGKYVNNITLLIGQNGMGKSSIFELISFNEVNRNKYLSGNVFFSIYHVEKDIFYFEGSSKFSKLILDRAQTNKGNFFFTFDQDGKYKQVQYNKRPFIHMAYQHLYPNISWTERKRILVEKNKDIIKKIKSQSTIDQLISFIEFSSPDFPINITFKQREGYSNNPNELYFLYHGNFKQSNLDLNNYTKIVNDFSNKFYSKDNPYKRSLQNKLFGSRIKDYYILRLFEKKVISEIKRFGITNSIRTNNSLKKERQKIESLKKIVEMREKEGYHFLDTSEHDNLSQEMNKRISYLISVLNNIFDKSYNEDLFIKLNSLPDNVYIDFDVIKIGINGDERDERFFIKDVVELYNQYFIMKFQDLSDGQMVYANTYSQIFSEIKNCKSDSLILVLDEPDLNLHPEWSRNFINTCIEIANTLHSCSVQLIISSHSPFMISDVPKKNVYTIKKNNLNDKHEIHNANRAFAGNLLDIMSDSFYLSHSMGEFARNRLMRADGDELIKLTKYIDDPLLKELFSRKINKKDKVNDNNTL